MTTAQVEKVPVSGGVKDILSIVNALNPLFGTGTTKATSTSTTSADPAALAQLDALLNTVLSEKDSQYLDQMVEDIMVRAKQEFAPVIGQSISTGARAYSDTTLKQLAGEASARATQAAAREKLNFITNANQSATNLIKTKVDATKTTTTNTEQRTTASPAGKAIGYGMAGLQLYSLLKKNKDKLPTAVKEILEGDFTSIFGGGIDPATIDMGVSFPGTGTDIFSGGTFGSGTQTIEIPGYGSIDVESLIGGSESLVDSFALDTAELTSGADLAELSGAGLDLGGLGGGASIAIEGGGEIALGAADLPLMDIGPGFSELAGVAELGSDFGTMFAAATPLTLFALAATFPFLADMGDKTPIPAQALSYFTGNTITQNIGRNFVRYTPESSLADITPLFNQYGGEEQYKAYLQEVLRTEYGTDIEGMAKSYEASPELIEAADSFFRYASLNPTQRSGDSEGGFDDVSTLESGYLGPLRDVRREGEVTAEAPDFAFVDYLLSNLEDSGD